MPLTLDEIYTATKNQYHLSLIAGIDGLHHIMNWVYISEDSSTHDFLKGGELIITTGIKCQNEQDLYNFISVMIQSHTCGMILNTGNYILTEHITQRIKDLCNHAHYPLLTMPWKIHIYDITRDYYNRIFVDTQQDTSITDAFLTYIEKDTIKYRDAGRILEEYNYLRIDSYDICILHCQDQLISEDLKLRLLFRMESNIKTENLPLHIAFYKNRFVFIFHSSYEEKIYKVMNNTIKTLQLSYKNLHFYAGIGTVIHNLEYLSTSYQRALVALSMAKNQKKTIISFNEMGFFKLLHSVNDPQLLQEYEKEYLEPIETYDQIHDTNYLETLHQYLLCNGSIQQVAANMFCHRNTITYRIHVLEENWHLNLDDTISRFHLMTAFFIRNYKYFY